MVVWGKEEGGEGGPEPSFEDGKINIPNEIRVRV